METAAIRWLAYTTPMYGGIGHDLASYCWRLKIGYFQRNVVHNRGLGRESLRH